MACAGTGTHMNTHAHTHVHVHLHSHPQTYFPPFFLYSLKLLLDLFSPLLFLFLILSYISLCLFGSCLFLSLLFPFPSQSTWGLLLLLKYSKLISASGPLYLFSLCLQVSVLRDLEKGITYLV